MEYPWVREYVLTYEEDGLTPAFQEIVCSHYLPASAVMTCEEGHLRQYTSLDSIETMNTQGMELFADDTQIKAISERFIEAMHQGKKIIKQLSIASEISLSEIKKAYEFMEDIAKLYGYFDYNYAESAYELRTGNPGIQSALDYVVKYKNTFREDFDLIFLRQDGLLRGLLVGISRQCSVPADDLEWYYKSDLFRLLDSEPLSQISVAARRRAYVMYKKGSDIKYFEGEKASKFIDAFAPSSPHVNKVSGKVGNGNGQIVQGAARVISMDRFDIKDLVLQMEAMREGEILVSSVTVPELIPACKKAAAIVTNIGGLLSHTAIISRELGIPCIVGTKVATQVFKTGDMIEVDANEGVVRVMNV